MSAPRRSRGDRIGRRDGDDLASLGIDLDAEAPVDGDGKPEAEDEK